MSGSNKPVIVFDTSGLNNLFDDPEAKLLKIGLRSAYFVRQTETNLSEIINTTDTDERHRLLDGCRSLLSAGDCIYPHHWILQKLIESYDGDPQGFDWQRIDVQFRQAEDMIARETSIDEVLSQQNRDHYKNTDREFKSIYTDARPHFDKIFEATSDPRPTIPDLLERFKQDDGVLWGFAESIYKKVGKKSFNRKNVRDFYDKCPPFRALILSLFVALYERCVRDERQGKSYRAGGVDLFYSAYLPYCNEFVTHDPKQLQALQMVAHLADLPVSVRSFDEFRKVLMLVSVPIVLKGVTNQAQIAAAIAQVEKMLAPDVVRIRYTVGTDWSGEEAVHFRILLSDAASKPRRLREVTSRVSTVIYQQIDPLNSWGLVPYLRFRSQSEQADLKEAAWA